MKLLKGSKLYSIFTGKCPVCHEGAMYKEKNPYKLRQVFEMHRHCPVCATKFKIEPSFFYGSMYVSYAVGVAISVAIFIILHFFLGVGLLWSFLGIAGGLFLLYPIIIRLSRNIWINLFFSYNPDKVNENV